MGAYVNPISMRKEEWLSNNAKPWLPTLSWNEIPQGFLPVCLVDNGPFTAAGIAYSEDEYNRFRKPNTNDMRPKLWYIAPIDKLHGVSPELIHYMKGKSYE